ncbi:MAG: serine hydrolase [Candidatus Aminicenantes bacterium]|jgi:CubicO group peptidase (beta-lactamase class C family)
MNKKALSFLFLLIFLCWAAPFTITAEEDKEKPDLSDAFRLIDIWLEAQRDYDSLPGISAAIVDNQEIIWSKGYGMADIEKQVKAEPGTIYSICSISKLFTSVAIMQLRDAGKLRLEDRVKDVLPWFNLQQEYEDTGPITIRSLLTHSSGLPRESDYPYWTGPDFPFPSREQLKAKLGSQKTLYPASQYFQYSNLGLSLLGEIVAEVSGIPFEQYIQENILKPLRLADTRTKLPESLWRAKLSTGYSALKRDGSRDMLPLFQAEGIGPAAGFSSTVLDLARFASWQFRVLEKGGEEILKASTLREMHRVHWVDPDWRTTWGLGFSVREVDGRTMVGHGGSCPGYRSTLNIDPFKKQAFIVMINAQGVSPNKYATGMRDVLKKASSHKNEVTIDLEAYSGYYNAQPWWGETVILPWYGKLAVLGLPSENPAQSLTLLKHIEEDTFRRIRRDETLGEEVFFERDDSGKVVRMWQHSNYKDKIR